MTQYFIVGHISYEKRIINIEVGKKSVGSLKIWNRKLQRPRKIAKSILYYVGKSISRPFLFWRGVCLLYLRILLFQLLWESLSKHSRKKKVSHLHFTRERKRKKGLRDKLRNIRLIVICILYRLLIYPSVFVCAWEMVSSNYLLILDGNSLILIATCFLSPWLLFI